MNTSNESAKVTMREFQREMKYANTVMVTVEVAYPQVEIPGNRVAEAGINGRIRAQVNRFNQYSTTVLYRQAIQEYRNAQNNEFPFRPYSAVLHYDVTYNWNCYFSLYRDQYEFTGGAHGNTVRYSDTWSLKTGRHLSLSQIFAMCTGYRKRLTEEIIRQADQRMKQQPGIFFEDYRELILKYFNEDHFYLTPDGLAIYYQQYEIAPYSSGIIVFTVPYKVLGWEPSC